MKVRKATPSDSARWVELRIALWPDCPEERHRLEVEQLLRSEGVVLLAEDSAGKVVGFVEMSIRRDHVEGTSITPVPYLEGWYVVPDQRGRGVGRALIEGAEVWALESGYREMASDAEAGNHGSIEAHMKLGFREVGRSVQFVRRLKEAGAGVEKGRKDHG